MTAVVVKPVPCELTSAGNSFSLHGADGQHSLSREIGKSATVGMVVIVYNSPSELVRR